MDKSAIDLVKKLCKAEPHERLGCANFKALKTHKFFKGIDWDALSKQVYPVPEGVPTINWIPQVQSTNTASILNGVGKNSRKSSEMTPLTLPISRQTTG